jgi:hypothetical protein
MIVTTDMFNTYSGNFEDSPGAVMLKGSFLTSAEEIVTGYLGYNPTSQQYTDVVLSGTGKHTLYVPSRNITQLHALSVNETLMDLSGFILSGDHIRSRGTRWVFPPGRENIIISYTAGWEIPLMPSVITLSILRVATLMLSEMGGNIGLTGKSFADNSRTFINYSNYKKYLQPLDSLRIIRF